MTDLPLQFVEMLQGLAEKNGAFASLATTLGTAQPTTSVRLNTFKPTGLFEDMPRVEWWSQGRYLPERPKFTLDPCLHAGAYYVQDASSMFMAHLIKSLALEEPVAYLDACAAPGGKTTAALDALPEGSLVVANEYDYRRSLILRENVIKWGCGDVIVTQGDTVRLGELGGCFDVVAADVPCSGEGMMRKDAEAVAQWSPTLVRECAQRQREIVDNLWKALRPGGFFIYSTCTFNIKENEDVVQYIIDRYDAESVEVPSFQDVQPSLIQGLYAYRFLPGVIAGEGLFISVLRKKGEALCCKQKRKKSDKSPKMPLPQWFPAGYNPYIKDGCLYALPSKWDSLATDIVTKLNCVMPGREVAIIKGRDMIPAHAVALRAGEAAQFFPTIELGTEVVLEYLRRNAIELPVGTPRGFIVVTHNGLPIGFVKNLGNRSNNMYPKEWRILH